MQQHSFALIVVTGVVMGLCFSIGAHARPEYALKEKLNCSACHVSPWGAGPRSTYGKVYGSHENKISKLSERDLYYGDFRVISYHPTHAARTTNGLALMQASASANIPIMEGENSSEVRALYTFNVSPLGGSYAREAYLAWQPGSAPDAVPLRITFGRFNLPFGLLTDEHRAYPRVQSGFSLDNYEMGAALSGNLHTALHYDLAFVNDFRSNGNFSNGDVPWGGVINVRWNPSALPFMLGGSGSYQHTTTRPQPYSASYYAGLSLDRLTGDKLGGSFLAERVDGWNQPNTSSVLHPSLVDFFVPTGPAGNTLRSALAGQQHSIGYFGQAKFTLTSRCAVMYRFDYLKPDTSLSNETFARHGAGLEFYLPANFIVNLRAEKAVVSDKAIADSGDTLGAQDDLLFMFRWWI